MSTLSESVVIFKRNKKIPFNTNIIILEPKITKYELYNKDMRSRKYIKYTISNHLYMSETKKFSYPCGIKKVFFFRYKVVK